MPGPARNFGIWRAKKVERGELDSRHPGFSVVQAGEDHRTPLVTIALDSGICERAGRSTMSDDARWWPHVLTQD
jgi:hypothetical protein